MHFFKRASSVTGPERFMFGLHVSAFVVAIDMWGTEEQTTYWKKRLNENAIFGTYGNSIDLKKPYVKTVFS